MSPHSCMAVDVVGLLHTYCHSRTSTDRTSSVGRPAIDGELKRVVTAHARQMGQPDGFCAEDKRSALLGLRGSFPAMQLESLVPGSRYRLNARQQRGLLVHRTDAWSHQSHAADGTMQRGNWAIGDLHIYASPLSTAMCGACSDQSGAVAPAAPLL